MATQYYLARDDDWKIKIFNDVPTKQYDKWIGNHYLEINDQMYKYVEPGTYQCVDFDDLFIIPFTDIII